MPESTYRPRRRFGLALTLTVSSLVAILAGCGGSSGSATPSTSATTAASGAAFPVTVTGANGPLTLAAAPQRIVSLGPTLTETLFAIGAGGQVVAADDNSNYPAQAPTTKLSAFQPNAEAVVTYKPDLVVLTNDANGLVASLGKLKVPALVLPAPISLDEAFAQMVTLGKATGHESDAQKLTLSTRDRISAAVASVPKSVRGKRVYHELDQTMYSVTSATFIGSVYARFGLTNIADKAEGAAAAGGYPQLSAEYIVSARPDLIVLADTKCCQQDAATLAKRPGFGALPAVKYGVVLAADDDIASRWGPRVAEFAEAVAKSLMQLA
jgi:iron complex transport system substrate-binding protein